MPPFDETLPPDDVEPAPDDAGGAPVEEELPQRHPLDDYWPCKADAELADAIVEAETDFASVVKARGFVGLWRLAYSNLYGQDPANPGVFATQQIITEGEHGEQLIFRIAEPSSFLRQQTTLATGQRAAFQAVALNTDTATLANAAANDAAVTYFYGREMPDSREREMVIGALAYAAAYIWWRWDKWAGDEVEVGVEQVPLPPDQDPTGEATAPLPVYGPSGAPVGLIKYPWDEFHELRQTGKKLWRGMRERRNRYELMALFPEHADKIRDMPAETSEIEQALFGNAQFGADELVVRHFYHVPIGDPNDKQNPLRAGRYAIVLPGLTLKVDRMPVTRKTGMPIAEVMPFKFPDIALGYAPWWDILACQQGNDQVMSDMISNVSLFGRQNAFKGAETEMDLDQLANGGGVFVVGPNERDPGFMRPPEMGQTGPFVLDYNDKKKQQMTGMNSVQRGDVSGTTSGEMAALFTNLAVEYNSDTQMALDEARKQSANIVADLIMLNAEYELIVQIVGVDQKPYLQKYRKDQLKGVRTIDMQTVPPMMRATAGRWQLWNMIKDVDPKKRGEAIMLITTGQWQQLNDTDSSIFLRINWENEQLAKGVKFPAPPPVMPGAPPPDPKQQLQAKSQLIKQQLGVQVSVTDDPYKDVPHHVAQYNKLCQDPVKNADAIAATLAHIQDHLTAYYGLDPMLATMLQVPPPPAPGAPAGKPGEVPAKPGDKGPAVPNGNGGAAPGDRLGPKVPEPAKPPPGAAV